MFLSDPTIQGIAQTVVNLAEHTPPASSKAAAAPATSSPTATRSKPFILGIGTALPGTGNLSGRAGTQEEAVPFLIKHMGLDEKKAKTLRNIGQSVSSALSFSLTTTQSREPKSAVVI